MPAHRKWLDDVITENQYEYLCLGLLIEVNIYTYEYKVMNTDSKIRVNRLYYKLDPYESLML